jgi:cation:H+ antiporter
MTALLAAFKRKDSDYIVGNVIGSNIFNVAFVLASLGLYDITFKRSFLVEMIILTVVSLILIALTYKRRVFYRVGGVIFLLSYVGIVCFWITTGQV